MRLEVTYDPEGTPDLHEVYQGLTVEGMREALVEYLSLDPVSYSKRVMRWFDNVATHQIIDGTEPQLGLINNGRLETWKVWQDFTS